MNTIIEEICRLGRLDLDDALKFMIEFFMTKTSFIGAIQDGILYQELPNLRMRRNPDDCPKEEYEFECTDDEECNGCENPLGSKNPLFIWQYNYNGRKHRQSQKYYGKYVQPHLYSRRYQRYPPSQPYVDSDSYSDSTDYCDNDSYSDSTDYCDETIKINEKLKKYLQTLNIRREDIFINGTIKLKNENGINHDHRGADHCFLRLPFKDEITLNDPTLEKFVSALYLLKSHKFDKWYELYNKAEITENANGNVVAILSFDHGS
jgi:hypothetical protein